MLELRFSYRYVNVLCALIFHLEYHGNVSCPLNLLVWNDLDAMSNKIKVYSFLFTFVLKVIFPNRINVVLCIGRIHTPIKLTTQINKDKSEKFKSIFVVVSCRCIWLNFYDDWSFTYSPTHSIHYFIRFFCCCWCCCYCELNVSVSWRWITIYDDK